MADRPHVALIVESSLIYGRRLLKGITRYIRSHEPWSVFYEQRDLTTPPPEWLADWHGDGVICRATNPRLAEMLLRKQIPAIDLSDVLPPMGIPRIWSDDQAIGKLAFEHLEERGFPRFALCGFNDQAWSRRRRDGFVSAARFAGHGEPAVYETPWFVSGTESWEAEQNRIGKWILGLPKPIGLMAVNDMRGQHVLDACTRIDVAVPEEVAVVGVDDDELLCNLCEPPLSSVAPNPERLGYEAAGLLARLMRHPDDEELANLMIEIPPRGVVTRQSSDVLAIDEPTVAAALKFIREHACQGCTVEQVLAEVPLSRSLLERRFRKYLGKSPQAVIRSVQIKRIKQLLMETDLPLDRIAELAGYKHAEYMNVVFKRETGQTPGAFRRQGGK